MMSFDLSIRQIVKQLVLNGKISRFIFLIVGKRKSKKDKSKNTFYPFFYFVKKRLNDEILSPQGEYERKENLQLN